MKIGILGSGPVGVELAKGFIAEGHEVYISTREPDGDKAEKLRSELPKANITDFVSAAKEGELIVFCINSSGVQDAINAAGADNLSGKVVIDTTNYMKQENGVFIYAGGDTSMAEQIQGWLPNSKVVKGFNTVGAATMYKPDFGGQMPTMFIASDDSDAKKQVSAVIESFGWQPLDTGGLITSRSLEPMAPVWVNYSIATGTPRHAFKML